MTHKGIQFHICGQYRHAKTDVYLVNNDLDDFLLLVQEYKWHLAPADPEPQLIAKTIAAFQAGVNKYRNT